MRLETDFMKELLRRRAPGLAWAIRLLPWMQRQGFRALATFVQISRDAVDTANSQKEAKMAAARLTRMFESGFADQPSADQTIVAQVIDEVPDLGLVWEAWCALEEEFAVPRAYALEFIRGLQMEADGYRPAGVEDLLRYAYRTGGVLGLITAHVLEAPEVGVPIEPLPSAVWQSLVDAGSAARLSRLADNIYKDFTQGRIAVPLEWASLSTTHVFAKTWAVEAATRLRGLARILDRSARESYAHLPYRTRLALSISLALHREHRQSIFKKLDLVFDEFVRQSAACFTGWLVSRTRLFSSSRDRAEISSPTSAKSAVRDASLALRNQTTRIGLPRTRDLSN